MVEELGAEGEGRREKKYCCVGSLAMRVVREHVNNGSPASEVTGARAKQLLQRLRPV